MSIEQNKAIAQRIYDDLWSKGDVQAAREIFAPNFKRVGPEGSPSTSSVDELLEAFVLPSRAAFPDWSSTVIDMVAEGDVVAVRSLNRGTHRGDFAGIPATGRTISFLAVDFLRFSGGKIKEVFGMYDIGEVFRQLGMAYGPTAGPQEEQR